MLFCYWLVLVQIVGESFPISSSTHVMLLNRLFSYTGIAYDYHDTRSYELLMHGAHVSAVIIIALFFYAQWSWLLCHWQRCWRIMLKIMLYTFVVDCCTALIYVFVHDICFSMPWYGAGLLVTTILLASARVCPDWPRERWTMAKAVGLGIVQGCALLPGISRLASTYIVARWMKLPAHKAFQISLLLQWPLIMAASARGVYHAMSSMNESFITWPMFMGLIAASCASWYGLRFVAWTAYTKRMWYFSFYMLIPLSVWGWLMWHQ